ncbi:hypothetical protein UFOVP95_7 [uncultured Caudovirales phage]|uniref:Uncharacterized protein n=1 Tax=uncultured Caudovirales phage TaxID=2100421 RepID=A0A6J5L6K6_9CAUD|nr:hypothetical protein UFOVP95_7 [uncultured Caudovirales phage]
MALPITIPYTFANATTSIPLSQLDTDFSTIYATVNGIGNGTIALSNVAITGGTITGVSVLTALISNGTSNVSISTVNGNVTIATAGTNAVTVDTSQNMAVANAISDSIGNVRNVPQNSKTSAYVLIATDNGKFIDITTGGVTVPSGIFSAGQSVTIYNDSSSNQTITQGSGVTMYQVGTATTGNRTLAQRGLCTVFCVASNTFVITGGGLT